MTTDILMRVVSVLTSVRQSQPDLKGVNDEFLNKYVKELEDLITELKIERVRRFDTEMPKQAHKDEFTDEWEKLVALRSNWYCITCGARLETQIPLRDPDGGFTVPLHKGDCVEKFWDSLKSGKIDTFTELRGND